MADLLRALATVAALIALSWFVMSLTAGLPFAMPFPWIFGAALVASVLNAVATRRDSLRKLWIAGASLSVCLLLAESWFAFRARARPDAAVLSGTVYTKKSEYLTYETALGYQPRPNAKATARREVGGRVIYDVTYTFGEDGLRRTRGNPDGPTYLFFGCSFMFGEGLQDEQTLPACFSAAHGERDNVLNLALHGYGPHQMLRELESGLHDASIHAPVAHAYCLGITHHVPRVCGRTNWGMGGPRYEWDGKEIVYRGGFHEGQTIFLLQVLKKSYLFNQFLEAFYFDQSGVTPKDTELYVQIVKRSSELVREKYGAALTVLFWDQQPESGEIISRLEAAGLQVVRVSQLLDGTPWKETVMEDGHPSAATNRKLGSRLAQRP